jgi:glucose uptake protein
MIIVESYPVAVVLCSITMLAWGSWANTQKLASKEWRFQLFYWDYALGVLLLSLVLALTMGSRGQEGRSFLSDLAQASGRSIGLALLGGVIFNLANLLLVAAIDIAGMAVAFPVGCGLSLVLGTVVNYIAVPKGNAILLFLGVGCVIAAAVLDAWAYRRLPAQGPKTTAKGIALSVVAGALMGFFYRFVAASMSPDFLSLEAGKLGPYTATVFFSLGLFLSNFVWNTMVMLRPFVGEPVPLLDYFTKGNLRLHVVGILGGIIWSIGMVFNIIAAGPAGFAIAFGLGYGGIMVAALWGVFVWREFAHAPPGTNRLLAAMFVCYLAGLGLIIAARQA